MTQILEFNATSGLTLTAKLFAIESDTVVASVVAVERTNDKGRFRATFTDIPAGSYRLNAFIGAVGGFANEVYEIAAASDVYLPLSEKSLDAEFDALNVAIAAITASVQSPSQQSVPAGSFNIWSGVDFSESFEVNVPSGWTRVLFTVKDGRDIDTNDDSKSVLQVQVSNPSDPSDGLTYLNKAEAVDSGLAELVVAGDRESVSLSILAEATIQLRQKKTYHWDIGVHVGTEKPYVTSPGTMTVQDVVTKTVPE